MICAIRGAAGGWGVRAYRPYLGSIFDSTPIPVRQEAISIFESSAWYDNRPSRRVGAGRVGHAQIALRVRITSKLDDLLDKRSGRWVGVRACRPCLGILSISGAFCEHCSSPNFSRSEKWSSCAAARNGQNAYGRSPDPHPPAAPGFKEIKARATTPPADWKPPCGSCIHPGSR